MKKVVSVVILLLICSLVFATQDPQSPIKSKQVSPDGQKVGYLARNSEGVWQLFVKNKDGSCLRQITFFSQGAHFCHDLVDVAWWDSQQDGVSLFYWSPDSQRVAVLTRYFTPLAMQKVRKMGYRNLTLLVVNLSDLTTLYLAGCDVKFSPGTAVDISQVKWLDIERIQFHYRFWNNQSESERTKIRRIGEGKPLKDNFNPELAWEQFFGGQFVASVVAKMIVNKEPIFAPECPKDEREFLEKIWKDPKLWVVGYWGQDIEGAQVEIIAPIKASEMPEIYLELRQGKIARGYYVLEGAP